MNLVPLAIVNFEAPTRYCVQAGDAQSFWPLYVNDLLMVAGVEVVANCCKPPPKLEVDVHRRSNREQICRMRPLCSRPILGRLWQQRRRGS